MDDPTKPRMGAIAVAREHDLALARRAAAGDRAAQRDLFHAQRASVHHTLFRILGSNRDLEDLLQDAFLEIFRALGSFRGDSTLARWCQTIATRTAFLAISRRKPPARRVKSSSPTSSRWPSSPTGWPCAASRSSSS